MSTSDGDSRREALCVLFKSNFAHGQVVRDESVLCAEASCLTINCTKHETPYRFAAGSDGLVALTCGGGSGEILALSSGDILTIAGVDLEIIGAADRHGAFFHSANGSDAWTSAKWHRSRLQMHEHHFAHYDRIVWHMELSDSRMFRGVLRLFNQGHLYAHTLGLLNEHATGRRNAVASAWERMSAMVQDESKHNLHISHLFRCYTSAARSRSYHARAAFEARMHLEEATQRERNLAVCMGLHSRLGANSPLSLLNEDMLVEILQKHCHGFRDV